MTLSALNITFVIPTFNEALRIERLLKSFLHYGQVLVIDNYSTDDTAEKSKKLGARVILNKNVGYGGDLGTMKIAAKEVQTEFVFFASASEFVPAPILEECKKIANGKDNMRYQAIACYRIEITGGKWIQRRKQNVKSILEKPKFLPLAKLNLGNHRIHREYTSDCLESQIKILPYGPSTSIHHLRNDDVSTSEIKHSWYSSNEAEQRFIDSRRVNLFTIFLRSIIEFLKSYISRRDFLSGRIGLINSLMRAQMQMNIGLKIWEKQHRITLEDIIAKNRQHLDELSSKELTKK